MNGGPVGVEGVVEVQHVGRDPIRQRRVAGRGALRGAHDGGRARSVAWDQGHRSPPGPGAHSGVAEPAIVQPSQSTRQRTAWCTTSAGRFSVRTSAANVASAPLTEIHRSPPLQSVRRKEILLYRLHGHQDPRSYDDRTSVETRTLLDFVRHTAADDIPADVLHESTRCLLDHLGLAIAGAEEPAARIAREQCRLLGGEPQAMVLGTGHRLRVTDAALGQRNRLSCTGFRRHPCTDDPASDDTAVRRGRGAGRVAGQPGRRPAGRARPRLRACRPGEQRAVPRTLRRGLAHDRHHRSPRLGGSCHQAARPRRHARDALPEHRGDPGRWSPRAVRHHDQTVSRRPSGSGGRLGGAARGCGIHRRTRPAAGSSGNVRRDVVGQHAGRSCRRPGRAVADLRQRGEALRVRRRDPPCDRRGP